MQPILNKSQFIAVWLLVFATIAAHMALYKLPPINLEWSFADAARYFETHNQNFLDRYFAVQANSLGVPLCAYVIHRIIPVIDIGSVPRLLAISGFVFMGAALLRLDERMGKLVHPGLLAVLVFLNPLIWTFGGRGTADFLPAAMMIFSLSLFWDEHRTPFKMAAAILISGAAVVLKYHAVILLPLIWLEAITRPNRQLKSTLQRMGLVTTAILIIPAIYLYAVKREFGFWLTPPAFQEVHSLRFELTFVVGNFISYAGYLALLLLPFSLLPLWRRMRSPGEFSIVLIAAAVLFLAGYLSLKPHQEMNFGPLDAYTSARVVGGVFCLCAGLLFLVVKDGLSVLRDDKEARRILICIALGIAIFMGGLSFTRPAQRYLIFVLPLAYLFIAPYLNEKKLLATSTIFLCVLLNAYITLSQYATGQAAIELTQKISNSGLIPMTDPGAILGHTGNFFPVNATTNKEYIVIVGESPNQLFAAESAPAPFIRKVFSIIPKESAAIPSEQ